jgi:Fe-S-cluster containining protein
MNIDQEEIKDKILNIKNKYGSYSSVYENILMLQRSSRIEKIYLVADKIVKTSKKNYPTSYCNACSLTCCNNDLFLPISFIEWKTIENYLNNKVSNEIKDKIKIKLNNINTELFKNEIKEAENEYYKYKNKFCPLLIDNKCSIKPYRPLKCRTYGMFFKEDFDINKKISFNHDTLIKACSLEISRWKEDVQHFAQESIYLVSYNKLQSAVDNLNLQKPKKLLIVWLKEYFDMKID